MELIKVVVVGTGQYVFINYIQSNLICVFFSVPGFGYSREDLAVFCANTAPNHLVFVSGMIFLFSYLKFQKAYQLSNHSF